MASVHHCDCGARIILAATAGRRQPLDWVPDPQGSAAAYCDALGTWRVRILEPGEEPLHPERRYAEHWKTCGLTPQTRTDLAGRQFRSEWQKARTDQKKAERNRRGRRPAPQVTGYRVNPERSKP